MDGEKKMKKLQAEMNAVLKIQRYWREVLKKRAVVKRKLYELKQSIKQRKL